MSGLPKSFLKDQGFVRFEADETLDMLGPDAKAAWASFADSWNDLPLDGFMADGGRYRRRRFAAFSASADGVKRKAHQPHWQSRDYNPLNGGVQRWFEPVTDTITDHPVTQGVIRAGLDLFGTAGWHVELHQFRIEAREGEAGQPTPEGMHRDGVDWVIVMLVDRTNVDRGVTDIYAPDGTSLGAFTLTKPGDAVFLDDHRVLHGVTPIQPVDPGQPALRDVLVVTFRDENGA